MALSDSSKEAVHLRSFLKEVLGQLKTTIIYNYNQGAGQLARNPVFHKRTKHVDIRHHFVRELVEEGTISVNYIPTTEMPSDILTKGLGPQNTTPVRHPWVYVKPINKLRGSIGNTIGSTLIGTSQIVNHNVSRTL